MKPSSTQIALQTALAYVLFGGVWILLSDQLLAFAIPESDTLKQFQTYKGWLFVVLSAALIYFLLRRNLIDQQKTEEQLREHDKRYRLLFENSMDAVLLTAPDGNILAANPAACQLFERSEAEICKLGRQGIVDTTDPRLIPALEERTRTGYFKGELTFLRKDGGLFPGEVSTALFTDATGQAQTSMIIRDVSQRKSADARIRHLNHLYATLSQINQTIVHVRDQTTLFNEICRVAIEDGQYFMAWIGLIDESNEQVKPVAFSGAEQGYLSNISIKYLDVELGRGPTGTAIREGRCVICRDIASDPRMTPWKEAALQRGYRSSASVPFRLAGQVIGAMTVYAAIPHSFDDEDQKLLNEIGSAISYALDMLITDTERKRVEEKLRQSQELFSSAFHVSPAGITITRIADGNIIDANEAFLNMFEFSREETIGHTSLELNMLSPEGRSKLIQLQLESGGLQNSELLAQTKSGRLVNLLFSSKPLELSGEACHITTLIDITERKQAEQELAKSHEQLRQVSARLADAEETERRALAKELHDLVGQSLTALNINLGLIRSRVGKETPQELAARFDSASGLVTEITDQVRGVMAELHPPVLDDYGLAAALRWYAERLNQQTGLQVKVIGELIEPRLPLATSMALFRIAQEATTNIVKHARASLVTIELVGTPGKAEMSVIDNGAGFDPSQQAADETAHWGLATMRERAESINGQLKIESGLGIGTKIRVSFVR